MLAWEMLHVEGGGRQTLARRRLYTYIVVREERRQDGVLSLFARVLREGGSGTWETAPGAGEEE